MTYFAMSDVHSFFFEMMTALDNSGFDIKDKNHKVIICGDLFDRGEQTLECYTFVKTLAEQGRLIYVRGNHEDLLEDAVSSIKHFRNIGMHHISNGTLKTLSHIAGCTEYDLLNRTFEWSSFERSADELLTFINNVSVDYFELDKSIFVHGWLPTTCAEDKTMVVHENWRDGCWREARWENGMEMFKFGVQPTNDRDKGKTIVCGHWHTSWGHHFINGDSDEFSNHANFNTFKKTNDLGTIVALDACTVFTHKVNCVVFDDKGDIIDV